MTEYIEREAVNALIKAECSPKVAAYLIDAVATIPTADVRPVRRGRWIPDYDYTEYDYDGSTPLPEPRKFQDGWQCSLCGAYEPSKTNFCHNCGADMR